MFCNFFRYSCCLRSSVLCLTSCVCPFNLVVRDDVIPATSLPAINNLRSPLQASSASATRNFLGRVGLGCGCGNSALSSRTASSRSDWLARLCHRTGEAPWLTSGSQTAAAAEGVTCPSARNDLHYHGSIGLRKVSSPRSPHIAVMCFYIVLICG